MDYSTWSKENLKRIEIKNGETITSVWCSEQNDLPLVVLLHGVSGDHVGLVPLAAELTKMYRVAIVELPGHGMSSAVPLPDIATLRAWFETALAAVEQQLGDASILCGHSFGCAVLVSSRLLARYKVVLLNPVPTPGAMYRRYSKVVASLTLVLAYVYNWRIFVALRGETIVKVRTPEVMRRVHWVGRHSHTTHEQLSFQSSLIAMVVNPSFYKEVSDGSARLVICGASDTVAYERSEAAMRKVFGSTKIVFLEGGHIMPIESPRLVAELITRNVLP